MVNYRVLTKNEKLHLRIMRLCPTINWLIKSINTHFIKQQILKNMPFIFRTQNAFIQFHIFLKEIILENFIIFENEIFPFGTVLEIVLYGVIIFWELCVIFFNELFFFHHRSGVVQISLQNTSVIWFCILVVIILNMYFQFLVNLIVHFNLKY